LIAVGFGFGVGFSFGFGSFLLNQHNHFSLPTVLNTLAHTLASF
jgi:hypothetical protein